MGKIKDIIGQKFNNLTTIKFVEIKCGNAYWQFRCDCGNTVISSMASVYRGRRKSCGCLRLQKLRDNGVAKRRPHLDACLTHLFQYYLGRATRLKVPFSLTKEQFIHFLFQHCFYCGIEPIGRQTVNWSTEIVRYNGIDRKFNQIGYTMDNCVPCCKVCNRLKNVLDIDQFYSWIVRVHDVIQKRSKDHV